VPGVAFYLSLKEVFSTSSECNGIERYAEKHNAEMRPLFGPVLSAVIFVGCTEISVAWAETNLPRDTQHSSSLMIQRHYNILVYFVSTCDGLSAITRSGAGNDKV
jgi:hypothetical protein